MVPSIFASKWWFAKVETADEAEKAIREVSFALYGLAGINFLLLVLVLRQWTFLGDVFFLLATAFLFRRSRSRALALVIAGYALVIGVITALGWLGIYTGNGGTNIILALIFLSVAYRGVNAAFMYQRQHPTETNVKGVVILTVIATLFSFLAFAAVLVLALVAGYALDTDAGSEAVTPWLLVAVVVPWFLVFGRVLPFVRRVRVVKPAA